MIVRERIFETKVHILKEKMLSQVQEQISIGLNGGASPGGEDLITYLKREKALPNCIRREIGEHMQGYKEEIWFKENKGAMQNYDTEGEREMIHQAIASFIKTMKAPDPKRPLREITLPLIPHLDLSLALDVLRDEVEGILGVAVDKLLGVHQDKDPVGKYLRYFGQQVQAVSIQDRETADKVKRQKYKKPCKWEGCGKHAWSGSGSDGHCYEHADPSKKLCKYCKRKTRQFAGGLCAGCSQQSVPRKRERVLCSCGLRESVKQDSRCSICIGGDQKKARQNRAGNC